MNQSEQIDHGTQEIVKLQVGDLVLTCARQRAELQVLREVNAEQAREIARLKALPESPS
jgi:hypothetical protein